MKVLLSVTGATIMGDKDNKTRKTHEKCGLGYPSSGLACIRPAGHISPTSICFSLADGAGVFLYQNETHFVDHSDEWPKDIILSDIARHEATAKPRKTGSSRRQAIMAQRSRNAG
jgi:hypothetical protein